MTIICPYCNYLNTLIDRYFLNEDTIIRCFKCIKDIPIKNFVLVIEGTEIISPHQKSLNQKERHGSPVFYNLLREMEETHDRKSHDYASNDNPYGNYEFAGFLANLFKHSPLDMGFVSRIGDKLYRLANLESSNKIPSNESIEDTERDLATIMTLWMAARWSSREKESSSRERNIGESKNSQEIKK